MKYILYDTDGREFITSSVVFSGDGNWYSYYGTQRIDVSYTNDGTNLFDFLGGNELTTDQSRTTTFKTKEPNIFTVKATKNYRGELAISVKISNGKYTRAFASSLTPSNYSSIYLCPLPNDGGFASLTGYDASALPYLLLLSNFGSSGSSMNTSISASNTTNETPPDYYANAGAWGAQAPEYPWRDDISDIGGGEGDWSDDGTDIIQEPDIAILNTNTISKSFFATTYHISFTALKGIAQNLWSTNFLDWVKQYFSNPLEGIINLAMIPISYSSDQYYPVIIGNYNTNQVGNIIFDQYKTVDCGYIDIPEKWGGAIDYKSRITLYLPFIGSHDLDVIEIIGGRLSVSYIVDLVTGSCVAFVKVKRGDLESVLYQFTGNCAYSMPVTQNSYNALLSSMLSASASVAVGVATGGASTPLMVGAGASVASDARPHVAHSGNLAGNTGYMGIKKPYIILTRPQQSLPADFGKFKGYQSHITMPLSDCKGFTKVENIHLEGITRATSAELSQIETLLKNGVIIS